MSGNPHLPYRPSQAEVASVAWPDGGGSSSTASRVEFSPDFGTRVPVGSTSSSTAVSPLQHNTSVGNTNNAITINGNNIPSGVEVVHSAGSALISQNNSSTPAVGSGAIGLQLVGSSSGNPNNMSLAQQHSGSTDQHTSDVF